MLYVDDLRDTSARIMPADEPQIETRRCWLMTDSDLDELHVFARRLGLDRASFQPDRTNVLLHHYELSPGRRALALRLGARPTTRSRYLRSQRNRLWGPKLLSDWPFRP